VIPKA
jgi:hypothetical protein